MRFPCLSSALRTTTRCTPALDLGRPRHAGLYLRKEDWKQADHRQKRAYVIDELDAGAVCYYAASTGRLRRPFRKQGRRIDPKPCRRGLASGFVRFAYPVFLYQRPSAVRTNMPTSAANVIQARLLRPRGKMKNAANNGPSAWPKLPPT